MTHILDIIMIPIQLIVAFFTLYYFIIAVFWDVAQTGKKRF